MMKHDTKGQHAALRGSGVPKVKVRGPQTAKARSMGTWIMMACCIPMVASAGLILWGMGAGADWVERSWALAPLGICLGAHLVMHKVIGHACHLKNSSLQKDSSHE